LCASRAYDGTKFHRVVAGYLVQGGDRSGSGKRSESIWGGKFADEITEWLKVSEKKNKRSSTLHGPLD